MTMSIIHTECMYCMMCVCIHCIYLHLPERHEVGTVPDPIKHVLNRFWNEIAVCRMSKTHTAIYHTMLCIHTRTQLLTLKVNNMHTNHDPQHNTTTHNMPP